MEAVIYRDSSGQNYGVQVSGHSDLGPAGNDVLCSAVSALTINFVNSVEAFTKDKWKVLAVNEEEGFLHAELESVSDASRLLMNSLVLGLQEIEKSYSRYITIRFEEESKC